MEDYPSNSHKKTAPKKEIEEPKKIDKVVEGVVVRRKKPFSKRFAETFIGGDAKTVGLYIVYDVLLPAVKDTLADAMSQGVERMLFGEARPSTRRSSNRGPGQGSYISYNRYAPNQPRQDARYGRQDPPSISRRARATHDFDEIVLASRAEAEEVIDQLFAILERYESVAVSDLYELVGITNTPQDEKWGWNNLQGASVSRVRNGYLLNLPKTEPLD
jgi:hypothetical protein